MGTLRFVEDEGDEKVTLTRRKLRTALKDAILAGIIAAEAEGRTSDDSIEDLAEENMQWVLIMLGRNS